MDAAGRVAVIRIRESAISQLPRIRGVEYVQKAEPMVPFHMVFEGEENELPAAPQARGDYTDLTGTETGTSLMGFAAAWAQGLTGRGQVIAMADTGLDSGEASTLHPDFAGTVKKGFSYGLGASNWADPMGHGTHVAGSVMSRGTASSGALRGGAYEAGMIPQGMWSPLIDNLTVPPRLNRLFDAAYAEGARLHTNSWGNPNNLGNYDAMAAQVDDFMWKNPDMLVIFAAGNSGVDADKDGRIDPGSVSSPGTSKNALTVGASENETSLGGIQVPISSLRPAKDNWGAEPIFSSKISDNGRGIAMFSSRGPTKDGRIKPDVVAPGTNILSNKSTVEGSSDMWGAYNKDYVWSGGTSMATPLTAGAAALVRQALAERFASAQPSAALVKAMLMHTALDLYPGQYGEGTATQELKTMRPNSDQGYGRVDMEKLASLGSATTTVVDNKAGLATGEEQTFEIKLKAGQKLLVNLVWTDSPGTPSAAKALVNDLDLTVEKSGRVLAQPEDRINNHEIVDLEASARGTYTIRVRGQNVPMGLSGKQPFALVYSVY
jgi:subtilisin family serine protease